MKIGSYMQRAPASSQATIPGVPRRDAGGVARRRPAAMSFIGGLAGADITTDHFGRVIERVQALAKDGQVGETVWLNEKDWPRVGRRRLSRSS